MGRELPYRTRKYIRLALMALVGIAILLYFFIDAPWTLWTLVGTVAIYVVFHAVLWRCPACGVSLGGMMVPRSCYNCGEPLEK